MVRNYYLILGVDCDATSEQIKSAYRREAKRLHPDHSGEGSEPFLAVQEAYEVLGDPGRRQAYDEKLDRERKRARQAARRMRPEPLQRRRCPVEPLAPTPRPSAGHDPFLHAPFPSLIQELFGRQWGEYDFPARPGVLREERENLIHLQVSLTRDQALRGGRIRVWLPGQIGCSACGGWGRVGGFECPHCLGSGIVIDELPVDLAYPGGLVDGSQARVPLGRLGRDDLALVLHFSVSEW